MCWAGTWVEIGNACRHILQVDAVHEHGNEGQLINDFRDVVNISCARPVVHNVRSHDTRRNDLRVSLQMEHIVEENDGYRVDQLSIQVPEVVKDNDLGCEPFLINTHLFVEFTIVAVKVARPHVLLRSVGRVDPAVDGLMLFRPPYIIVALARDTAGGKLLATKLPGILLRSLRILHRRRILSVNHIAIFSSVVILLNEI